MGGGTRESFLDGKFGNVGLKKEFQYGSKS
jgi:hypothetical protein